MIGVLCWSFWCVVCIVYNIPSGKCILLIYMQLRALRVMKYLLYCMNKQCFDKIVGLNFATIESKSTRPISYRDNRRINLECEWNKVAVCITSKITHNGYKIICDRIGNICSTPLASFYMLVQNWPEVVTISLLPSSIIPIDTDSSF